MMRFLKGVFIIFSDSHKIIATKMHENIYDIYGVKLDKDKLLWGSVAPDILPKYKFIRHYKDESLNYVVQEIINIIFLSRYIDFNKSTDPIAMKHLSKKIGIISHYLTDYVCLPHANRWTFYDNMVKHIKYESGLDQYVKTHDFKKNVINVDDLFIGDIPEKKLRNTIKNYINKIVEEYSIKTGFKNDLNFALSLNLKISYFILDTIAAYSEEINTQFAFEI